MREEAMTAAFASFLPEGNESMSEDEVSDFLRRHGLDMQSGGSRPGNSAIKLYLQSCRPAQLRALLQEGLHLDPAEARSGLASVTNGDASPETKASGRAVVSQVISGG